MTGIITHARTLLASYDVLFCDIWGVLHDGSRAFDAANDALSRFRAGGGTVILVSNAPMRADAVAAVLDQKAVARGAWDAIVCSGDIALRHISRHDYRAIHRIGPQVRDASFFTALPHDDVPIEAADAIACTGLLDDRAETAEAYRARLIGPAARAGPVRVRQPGSRGPCRRSPATLRRRDRGDI